MKNNTVSKGILFYIFLLLAVIVGVACVIGAILIFSPGTEIFGISYYLRNYSTQIERVDAQDENSSYLHDLILNKKVVTLNIEADYADVTVKSSKYARINFGVESNVNGILKSGVSGNFSLDYNYDQANKSFNISLDAPDLSLFFSDEIEITLYIPFEIVDTGLNLNISSTKNSQIEIGDIAEDNFSFKSLSIVAETNSDVYLGRHASFSDSVSINVPGGKIVVSSDIDVSNLDITSKTAKIELGDVKADLFKLRTESSSIKIKDIYGDLEYDARKGVIMINDINGSFSCSEAVIISNITINKVTGEVLLPSAESSNISIAETYGLCSINTTTGNVTLKNAHAGARIETQSGTIDVLVNTNPSLVVSYSTPVTTFTTKNGEIKVKYNNIVATNTITTESGNVDCSYKKENLNFTLSYDCTKKVPTLSLGVPTSTGTAQNTDSVTVGQSGTDNVLSITNTNGTTNISDTYVYNN